MPGLARAIRASFHPTAKLLLEVDEHERDSVSIHRHTRGPNRAPAPWPSPVSAEAQRSGSYG